MKQIKHLAFLMLALTFALGFTACGDDDDDDTPSDSQSIVGKWKCTHDAYGDLWDDPYYIIFKSDGTGYEYFEDEDVWRFEYVATSTKLTLYYDDDSTPDILTYSITSNGKKLTIIGMDDDDMSVLEFTRQ